jgi:hypothetical protein
LNAASACVGVILYHSHADGNKGIGVYFVDSCGAVGKESGQVFQRQTAALFVFVYPVRLVHKVYAQQPFVCAVTLRKGLDIIIDIAFHSRFICNDSAPSVLVLSALAVVEGKKRGHKIYLMLFGDLEKFVYVRPVLFRDLPYFAGGLELYAYHGVAVHPNADGVYSYFVEVGKVAVPEGWVEAASEIVPVLPGRVYSVYP